MLSLVAVVRRRYLSLLLLPPLPPPPIYHRYRLHTRRFSAAPTQFHTMLLIPTHYHHLQPLFFVIESEVFVDACAILRCCCYQLHSLTPARLLLRWQIPEVLRAWVEDGRRCRCYGVTAVCSHRLIVDREALLTYLPPPHARNYYCFTNNKRCNVHLDS